MRVLRLLCKQKTRSLPSVVFLRTSLRTLVNYFSVIDQNKQINSIYYIFNSDLLRFLSKL